MESARIKPGQTKSEPVVDQTQKRRAPVTSGLSWPLTLNDAHSPILRLGFGFESSGTSVPPPLQAKLIISAPGDQYEQEADRVAEQIMRMPDTTLCLQRKCACGGATVAGGSCQECSGRVQRQRGAISGNTASAVTAPSIVHDALSLRGQRLDQSTRDFFEPRFGHDFSDVRVHTEERAAESARAVNALAYTVGHDMVFGSGEYAPATAQGKRLLAHELTHVAQQRVRSATNATTVWRIPVTADLTSVAQFEWTGRQQRMTATRINEAFVSLSFEPSTGDLTCTFRLRWRFPASWRESWRQNYVSEFVARVTNIWQNRFPLVRFELGRATTTRARVLLSFVSVRAPDIGDDTAFVNWLMTPAGRPTGNHWTMVVHDSSAFRDQVEYPIVHLDPNANYPQPNPTDSYPDRFTTERGAPPYQHYFDRGITPGRGTAPGGVYHQVATAHEFGHMIGLADEYVLSSGDYQNLVASRGQRAADASLRRRRTASARIQNIGEQVTLDAYRPFANFLHVLTGEDWRVR